MVKGSTGYYFDGVYSVYPGLGGALKLSGVEVVTVNLTAGPMDTITVTPMKDASGKTGAYHKGANDKTYYVQKGFGYTFTAVSSSTEIPKIAYGSIANASAAATLDFTSKADKVTLKGYAGLAADGTVTMSYGTTSVTFDVKSGVFEVIAPRGQAMTLTADLTQKDDQDTYKYHGTIALANEAVVDGASVILLRHIRRREGHHPDRCGGGIRQRIGQLHPVDKEQRQSRQHVHGEERSRMGTR